MYERGKMIHFAWEIRLGRGERPTLRGVKVPGDRGLNAPIEIEFEFETGRPAMFNVLNTHREDRDKLLSRAGRGT